MEVAERLRPLIGKYIRNLGKVQAERQRRARKHQTMSILVVGTIGYDTIETQHGGVSEALGGSASFFLRWRRAFFRR